MCSANSSFRIKRSVLIFYFIIAVCIEDCAKNPTDFLAISQQAPELRFLDVVGGVQQFEPITGFAGLFVGGTIFSRKIGAENAADGFFDVGPNGGAASQKLLAENIFLFV